MVKALSEAMRYVFFLALSIIKTKRVELSFMYLYYIQEAQRIRHKGNSLQI